jgi:hypothetical protein
MDNLVPKMMKALIKTDPVESYKLVELPVPIPGEGQSLIKIGVLTELISC